MADPFAFSARKDWIGPRTERWTDYLPAPWQTAINTSPLVQALQRRANAPSFEQVDKDRRDNIPGNSPIDRIAEGRSTIAAEYPKPMHPFTAEALDQGGLLANFLGPGAARIGPRPQVMRAPEGGGGGPPVEAPSIRAYHGSPHDFDKFDMGKIGTGEGAQAYGRGLYFAESEAVAKSYRDALGGHDWGGQIPSRIVDGMDVAHDVRMALQRANGNPSRARQLLEQDKQQFAGTGRDSLDDGALKLFDEIAPTLDPKARGRMYEVRINADPDHFLNYDQLQQTPHVVEALAKLKQAGHPNPLSLAGSSGLEKRVLDVNRAAVEAGIPGIRYKDAGSRDVAGPGTSNYVVFNDKLIEILRKYGLIPPVASGAAQAVMQGQSDGGQPRGLLQPD